MSTNKCIKSYTHTKYIDPLSMKFKMLCRTVVKFPLIFNTHRKYCFKLFRSTRNPKKNWYGAHFFSIFFFLLQSMWHCLRNIQSICLFCMMLNDSVREKEKKNGTRSWCNAKYNGISWSKLLEFRGISFFSWNGRIQFFFISQKMIAFIRDEKLQDIKLFLWIVYYLLSNRKIRCLSAFIFIFSTRLTKGFQIHFQLARPS